MNAQPRERLTIYRRYFTESDCYRSAPRQTVHGVQVHSTGANNPWLKRYVQPDDGRIGKNQNNNSHNKPGGNVCANAYIGKQADGTVAVYQALPWDQRCWLSGSGPNGNANRLGYVGFEICEDGKTDYEYFLAAMDEAAKLTAYLCQEYGIDPDANVLDHHELHALGLASNHGDITHWLKLHGESMDSFRGMVMGYLMYGIQADYIDCDEVDIMYQAKVISTGYLNLRSGKSTAYASIARMNYGATVNVLDDSDADWWRVSTADGKVGWAMKKYMTRVEPESDAESGTEKQTALRLETLTSLKALLVPLLQEIETAIQELREGG